MQVCRNRRPVRVDEMVRENHRFTITSLFLNFLKFQDFCSLSIVSEHLRYKNFVPAGFKNN